MALTLSPLITWCLRKGDRLGAAPPVAAVISAPFVLPGRSGLSWNLCHRSCDAVKLCLDSVLSLYLSVCPLVRFSPVRPGWCDWNPPFLITCCDVTGREQVRLLRLYLAVGTRALVFSLSVS